jgi:hypothetical protein
VEKCREGPSQAALPVICPHDGVDLALHSSTMVKAAKNLHIGRIFTGTFPRHPHLTW